MFKTQLLDPIPHDDGFWELDVPHDNSCFFWASALSYLLPSIGDQGELKKRCSILLGDGDQHYIQQLIVFINHFNPFDCNDWFNNAQLQFIIQRLWRNRLVDYIKQHKDVFYQYIITDAGVGNVQGDEQKFEAYLLKIRDPGMWAGDIERYAAIKILQHNIHFISGNHFDMVPSPKLTLVVVNAAGDILGPGNHFHYKLSPNEFLKIAHQDLIPVEEDKLPPDLNLEALSIADGDSFPSYVFNIPVVISSDSDGSSSEEADDESFKFPEFAFNNPKEYVRLLPAEDKVENKAKPQKNHQRGTIDTAFVETSKSPVITEGKAEKILSVLSSTAFVKQETRENYKRLKVVFGLNKMRSLSSARNRAIGKALHAVSYSSVASKSFGFFWDGIWQKKTLNGWQVITYREAREFYKRLKKQNKMLAKKYRAEVEKSRGHMVPYREIRDAIKNHPFTKDTVVGSRNSNKNPFVYLVFFDGDIISANGAFSVYDKLYCRSPKVPPVVMSGGYLVAEKTNPLMELGVTLDLAVRHETTQIIRGGAYYPEPNTLTLIELGKEFVEENFSDGNLVYESPKEMPILMKKILFKRKLDAQNDFHFDKQAAIITTCPKRMIREFSATKNHQGKIISWKLADFETMRSINQSHFSSRSWAKNILATLQVPSNITVVISGQSFGLSDNNIIDKMLVSLISRIFNAYDPIFIAKRALSKNPASSFRQELLNVLQNYEKLNKELLATTREYNKLSKSKKAVSPAVKAKKENATKIWMYIDNLTDLQECQMVINQFLNYPKVNSISAVNIMAAAKQSQLAVIKILRESLSINFTDLFLNSLITLHNDYSNDPAAQNLDDPSTIQLHPAYSLLLSVECLESKNVMLGHFRGMKEQVKSVFGGFPLHFAAMKGDEELVRWLFEKRGHSKIGWIGDISKPSAFGILPVHCAIRYCAEHSENHEIIKLLTNQHTINAEISSDGYTWLTAFTMAMVELKNPLPLLEYFVKTYGDQILINMKGLDFDAIFVDAILGRFSAFSDFIIGYISESDSVLREAIYDMAPDVDKNLIQYGLDNGVDLDEIKDELGESDSMFFESNLRVEMGWHSEDSEEEILGDSYDDQNEPGFY